LDVGVLDAVDAAALVALGVAVLPVVTLVAVVP
jgi:hypothetical protein